MSRPTPVPLAPAEKAHLGRMLRAERRFPVLMIIHLVVAAGLTITYTWSSTWNGSRFVLVLLILMAGRAHLRLARSARLLRRYHEATGEE